MTVEPYITSFGTHEKIGTIQRRLAWPLRKDDTRSIEKWFQIFLGVVRLLWILMIFWCLAPDSRKTCETELWSTAGVIAPSQMHDMGLVVRLPP